MDVAVLVDVEDDDGFVDGVVVGAEGDLPTDALYGFCTGYLFESLLQVVWCKVDVVGEGDIGGLQHGERGVIGENGVGGSARVAVLATRMQVVRVVGVRVIREEFRFLCLQVLTVPLVGLGKGGEVQVLETGASTAGIV